MYRENIFIFTNKPNYFLNIKKQPTTDLKKVGTEEKEDCKGYK